MVPDQPGPDLVGLQHSLGHIDCPACNAARDRILAPAAFAKLTFNDAARAWLSEHSAEISPKSYEGYEYYIRCLNRFFSALPLDKVHIGHIQSYQQWRQQPHPEVKLEGAGPSTINHEINTLAQVMSRAGVWTEVEKFYKPMRLPKAKIGQAIEDSDEDRLFKVAMMSPRWKVAYWASLVTAHTAAGASEVRHLHLGEIDLYQKAINIREGTKNDYRIRTATLNATAHWAIRQIIERYYKACRRWNVQPDPQHYVLYRQADGKGQAPHFDTPMTSWKKAWWSIRTKAGLPTLRMYDLRHHALTRMLEDPNTSEQTVKDLAGQVSKKILDRYSHIRMKAKRDAVARLERREPVEGDEEKTDEIPGTKPRLQ